MTIFVFQKPIQQIAQNLCMVFGKVSIQDIVCVSIVRRNFDQ